jgi:hypothetical protein
VITSSSAHRLNEFGVPAGPCGGAALPAYGKRCRSIVPRSDQRGQFSRVDQHERRGLVSRWMLIPGPMVIIFFDLQVYPALFQHLSEHCREIPEQDGGRDYQSHAERVEVRPAGDYERCHRASVRLPPSSRDVAALHNAVQAR